MWASDSTVACSSFPKHALAYWRYHLSDCFLDKCVFYICSGFVLPGWLPGDQRPFPNERSRNSHLLGGPKTLIGQDLTHFYLTQSLGLHLFLTTRDICWECDEGITRGHGKNHFPLFWSQNQLIP